MDKILKAVDALNHYHTKLPFVADIRHYIETGDPAVLKKINPGSKVGQYWGYSLADALAAPNKWGDADRRLVHVMHAGDLHEYLWTWFSNQLQDEKPDEDFHAILRAEIESLGVSKDKIAWRTVRNIATLTRDGRPTSAGRYVLGLSDSELRAVTKSITPGQSTAGPLTELLGLAGKDRLAKVVGDLLEPREAHRPMTSVVEPLLKHTGDTYLPQILEAYERDKNTWNRYHVSQTLYAYDPKRFADLAMKAARASLHGSQFENAAAGTWLVNTFGEAVLPDILTYFTNKRPSDGNWRTDVLDAAVAKLGRKALPVILAVLDGTADADRWLKDKSLQSYAQSARYETELQIRHKALQHLISLNDTAHDDRIEAELRRSFNESHGGSVVNFLGLAGRWKPDRLEKDVWGLLQHKSKPVRGAAARTLARLGDAALPQAKELLRHKKADVRSAAVTLLSASSTEAALAELEARLDDETNDDVRDQMLLGLAAAWEKQGRVITRKDVEARIKKAADKLKDPGAKWADPARLPPLYWTDGEKLSRDAVAYLLYRQSRAKEMQPDVEVAPLYNLLDRKRSADFARAILQGFLSSTQEAGDRWALVVAGLLGGDSLVPDITAQIRDWVEKNRGKLAEYAVQALALLGTDVALLAVDAMAIRYRSKMKNVGRAASEAFVAAAEKQGITPEELGDRVVPWLGFEPGKSRIIEAGGSKIEASIGTDLKLAFKDLAKNKPVKSLPKSASKDVLDEFKDLAANLREITKAQILRLENLLVRQRRWPADQWKKLFLQHPLLLPFAVRLVWGHYDGARKPLTTFRALPDRTLTTNADEAFDLPDTGSVGMVHPLELTDEERSVWQNHLADYEIEPPFPQLERQVIHCSDEQKPMRRYRDLANTSINAMTFKGRAERLGWYRGSVADAGYISTYHKTFPSAGVDVFLGLDGMYIGVDMYTDIKLQEVNFVKQGSVKIGSYTYDEPSDEKDPRIVPLGEVPPIVFSEVMGDLQKIAGKKDAAAEES